MKPQDLTNKSRTELNHLLVDLRAKLLKLNFDLADNKVKDVSQIKKTKRDIARVLTMLNNQRLTTTIN
ncbi:MAG: 50S ribosomal protein L29 [Candidatus Yanofskybacteria bacterium RIFCSPHIGHO2_01_FULL_39_8b]|uniref:Large ribosomal subunit protein uL29 n=1 Tax=Candidatus Yanofskybacteria bacterium RIFCSPHIGHO2_01_FULL_39_8b TaxID=1802659 RepID=A0A1F8EBD1_9BACT|nr:MAG: 50S ribosomal protein L29 [Candidatus Yanofskybacteria bacterium RIFCSPHIGHO2_01_FULL_39_8b]